MSNISSIYDGLVTRISTVLPNHNRLPFAVDIDQNIESRMVKGWGLSFAGGAVNTKRVMAGQDGKMSIDRTFLVSIVRKVYAQDQNIASRALAEKQLLEDHKLLVEDLEKDPSLGLSANGLCINARYEGDSGLEFAIPDERQFIMIVSSINIEYFEQL